MGGGNWNTDFYEERQRTRAETNTPVFKHHEDVKAGRAENLHEQMDPSKFLNGRREARDSAEHPNSRPIIVGLDVTGSMRDVPGIVQGRLDKFMTTILTGGFLADPQVQFTAIGDSHTDAVPLQVGQFESGIEMETDLTRIFIEGNGGGTGEEGYEMLLYCAVHHTSTDAWEKRKEKGYIFLIGDEHAYPEATADNIHKIFGGERPSQGVVLSKLVKDAQERYHVFFVIPTGTLHGHDSGLHRFWSNLIGAEHVLRLEDSTQICDLMALSIGLTEGTAKPGAIEALSPAIKEAIDPVLAASKKTVADAKSSGAKTARL